MTAKAPPVIPSLGQFRWSATHPPAEPSGSFAGKTVLITGATAGIGLEAATKFAALGASKIIIGARSHQRGNEAKELIEQKSKCSSNVIQIVELDMESYSSIQGFVNTVSKNFKPIHFTILNAGIHPMNRTMSSEGIEMTLQVNAVSSALLAILLLPVLKESTASIGKPVRLEIVTSQGYLVSKTSCFETDGSILEKLKEDTYIKFPTAYVASKLLQMWLIDQIVSRTPPSQVIINTCCPGVCATRMSRDLDGRWCLLSLLSIYNYFCARSAEQGSRTVVSGALLGEEVHGRFWSNDYNYEYVTISAQVAIRN
jgi:NAD(P)-dependent dehydrogenase (short-subunit alcohol dehydrogenase family)